MFDKIFGPYYHPRRVHAHPYKVGFVEGETRRCTVMKCGANNSEYVVDLDRERWGEICECPHHTIRKAPCHHIDFARKAMVKRRSKI